MLKKSLIAIAILALAMPAFAASTQKYHKPWDSTTTVTYHYQDVHQITVCMDVGYWIQIDYSDCIEVEQDSSLGDPYKSYSGCATDVKVTTNFAATLKATAAATSLAGGDWSATIDGYATKDVNPGETLVDVCVSGTNVEIKNLTVDGGDSDNVEVAVVTISVIPTQYKDSAD